MKLFYARTAANMPKGHKFRNARFFDGVDSAAKEVTVEGAWPAIEDAYRGAGVKVNHGTAPTAPAEATAKPAEPAAEPN